MSVMIGLTGPTGAGKSLAASEAEKFGLTVIDCDITARKATEKGTEGLKALTDVFGKEILNGDGTLNRKALAKAAFATEEKTELLNRTLLPHIVTLVEKQADGRNVLVDAPTLFQSGLDRQCFKTVAVLADDETRIKRIMRRDGITLNEARLRLNAGKTDAFFKDRADYVIYNNGNESEFKKRFCNILKEITEEL